MILSPQKCFGHSISSTGGSILAGECMMIGVAPPYPPAFLFVTGVFVCCHGMSEYFWCTAEAGD